MGFISLIALMFVGKRLKALTKPNNRNLTELKIITCVTVFDRDHVNYFPNLIFKFVRRVIANINQYNMFQSISLWCAMQSPTQNMLSLFVKHLDMYQSLKYAKRHTYEIVWPFWTNSDLTRLKHHALYMHGCYH